MVTDCSGARSPVWPHITSRLQDVCVALGTTSVHLPDIAARLRDWSQEHAGTPTFWKNKGKHDKTHNETPWRQFRSLTAVSFLKNQASFYRFSPLVQEMYTYTLTSSDGLSPPSPFSSIHCTRASWFVFRRPVVQLPVVRVDINPLQLPSHCRMI